MTRTRELEGAPPSARQLALGVEINPSRRLDNFVAGPNAAALAALRGLLAGEVDGHVYLHGAQGAGKSHLLQGCCAAAAAAGRPVAYLPLARHRVLDVGVCAGLERASLVCLDDVDRVAGARDWERALFRLYNESEAAGARLLFAGRRGPDGFELPDLRSRLFAALAVQLAPPDDAHRAEVLRRHARERGVGIGEDVLAFILARQSRDLGALVRLLEELDRFALAEKRRVTVALVRDYLRAAGARAG